MGVAAPRVLLLDDDPAYGRQIAEYLEFQGCTVQVTQEPEAFEEQVRRSPPDIVLLDQRLGEVRGTEILLRLRQHSSVPCIIVTGLSETLDRILNLEVGADDEVEKSAPPRELLARIRAVLRRNASAAKPATPMRDRRQGGWTLAAARRDLIRPDGTACGLTGSEYETLALLWDQLGQPVSRKAISDQVFKRSYWPGDRAVDTVVMKLRMKIGTKDGHQVINSVRLAGYVFTGFGQAAAEA
ncbi:response regulator transcription factor [Falsiroseomonas selenitidurans]|uniref:Response regulator transcription factor n=1 Tax=Falsiroseomonas selenitidurans TaxID=2716335 RepID=A0ABX1E864_9PROT|nr:response regulator transcription factor [Falsiroseomonas selenitidurans]NKC33391.1 response regulator transcription factor [Falsiroseomonas selenitidurans]